MHKQIPTKDFRKFVKGEGCIHERTKGSHETWARTGMLRPIIIQANLKEVPEFIVKNNLKTLGVTMEYFLKKISEF